jgi:hypothetical protein
MTSLCIFISTNKNKTKKQTLNKMKLINFAIFAILTTCFIACSKDEASTAPIPTSAKVEGLYNGKYGFDNETPSKNYTLKFTNSGTIQEIGQASVTLLDRERTHSPAIICLLLTPCCSHHTMITSSTQHMILQPKPLSGTWGYNPGGN